MYIRIVLGFVPTFFYSKNSFLSGVGYVMRPILLIMWTAFQSFKLRYNNNNNSYSNNSNNRLVIRSFGSATAVQSHSFQVVYVSVKAVVILFQVDIRLEKKNKKRNAKT